MKPIIVTMKHAKETANTVRYNEEAEGDERPTLGSQYILKSKIDGEAPKEITVTVEEKTS